MRSKSVAHVQHWTKDDKYLISTDPALIPLNSLNNDIFNADDFSWGKSLPDTQLRTLIDASLCFGLYEISPPPTESATDRDQSHIVGSHHPPANKTTKLIGFARFITDHVTVHYLTDVYILPTHRAKGLGVWLMQCIDEVFQSSSLLRGMILIADRGSRTEEFYRKHLSMGDLAGEAFCMDRKGRGA
jgi:GNAT superfamily N-acetyltransferase